MSIHPNPALWAERKRAAMKRTITSVRFVPDGLKIKVIALLSDGVTSILFSYYPDELSFTEEELAGLTVSEAVDLFHRKDTDYLQS